MKVLNSPQELNAQASGELLSLTIGNFDGVHLGHRFVIEQIKKQSKDKLVVVTFVPHPAKILAPNFKRFLINSYNERRSLLETCGVDYLLEYNFTRDFSTLGPKAFLDQFISSVPNLRTVFIGHDFKFGSNKSGNFEFIKENLTQKKINVLELPKFDLEGVQASSSSIRKNVLNGKIVEANKILGRSFFLTGTVVRGKGRGKDIGLPTANLHIDDDLILPSNGVYVTRTKIDKMLYNSVTNIGFNPTFEKVGPVKFETHIFDFKSDIYGREISVNFELKIRDEMKFDTVNALIEQINKDIQFAKKYYIR